MVIYIMENVDNYVDKLWITFLTRNTYRTISSLDISQCDILYQTGLLDYWINASVKHYHFTDSQYLSCKNVENTSCIKKYIIILYYYGMFFMPVQGHSLHFRTNVRLPERAYLLFPHLDHHFEFDTEFGKTLKNQHFHHFLYR